MIVLSKMVIFFIASTNACLKSISIAEKLMFATRQQAADSTRNTTKRSNTVAEIQFFRYKFCSIDNSRSIAASAVGLYFNRSEIREFQTK